MKRTLLTVIAVLMLALGGASSVLASPSAQSGQCPGATTIGNTPTDDGTIVLDAGLTVCIHAGNGNTGTFVTDGVSTLADYIEASGLLNNGGQVPNVSNYVIYSEEPSSTPSATPSVQPSVEPSSEPSADPSSPPSPTPTLSPSGTPVPTSSSPTVTPPPTDTQSSGTSASTDPRGMLLLVAAVGFVVMTSRLRKPSRRRR